MNGYRDQMLRKPYKILLLFVLLTMSSGGASAKIDAIPKQAQDLAPHKALYEIQLLSKRSSSQIINIHGQMFYEWTQGCDAWETKHRFNLLYEYSDGPSMRITSDFATFETFDGNGLDFSSRRMRDGDIFEEIRGHASASSQKSGMVGYNLPEKMNYTLPKGSLFPMGHTMNVIKQIQTGQKIYTATIFDGSDEQGPRQVNSIIARKTAPPKHAQNNTNIDQSLLDSQAHKIRLAYFILDDDSAESEHEMDVIFHENGIISSMIIDYEDFSISQKLIALEPLKSSCGIIETDKAKDRTDAN